MAVTPSRNISKSIVQAHAFAGLLDFLVVVVGVLGVGAALWLGSNTAEPALAVVSILFWTVMLCLGMSWGKHMLRMVSVSAASALPDEQSRASVIARLDAG